MSWLFGGGKDDKPQVPSILGISKPPPGGDDGSKGPEGQPGGTRSEYSFDSRALERAAKAAKDLEKSRKNFSIFMTFYFIRDSV